MKSLLRLLLKTQLKTNFSKVNRTIGGFTLLELLIAMIMTFLILTPLLAFVVDILNTDRKEQVKSNTEQEVQASLDFIAQDLAQAVYIYDNTGVTAISDRLVPAGNNPGAPILVFWKRQLLKKVLPTLATGVNTYCTSANSATCNDSYVYSLVAYYLKQDNNAIWCQPVSASNQCPARITRYQIQDGVLDPSKNASSPPVIADYLPNAQPKPNDASFPLFSLSLAGTNIQDRMNQWPLQTNGTTPTVNWSLIEQAPLVNYIDTSIVSATANDECQKALGTPKLTDGTTDAPEPKLRIATTTNSFYACVDSSKTVARVFIRGNAMRKMQNNAPYSRANAAFFPAASIQVQGLGELAQ